MYNCLQRSPAGNPFAQYQSTVTMNTSPSPSRTSVSTTTSTISPSLNVAELWERVNEVIDTNISYIEKTGYLEAKVKSPHLIEIETNVERFLSFEKWNIYATAQRIVKYWEWKRTLYGEYRTFLPILDISGTYGAMDSDDVQYIKSGIVTLLPDDDHGNLVAYFCPYRLSGDDHWGGLTQVKRSRITFYFLCVFVETYYSKHPYSNQQRNQPNQLSDESDETTSTPSTATTSTDTASFVLLAVIQSFVSRPNTNFRDVVTEAMPIQLLRTDMIFHPPLSTTSSLMNTVDNSLFSYLAKSILRAFIPTSPTLIQFLNVHTMYCFNPHDIAMQLEQKLQYGLRAANLPIEIGGNWSYDIFNKWFEATHQHYVSLNENKVQLLLLLQSQQSRSGNIGVGGEADDNNSNTLQSIQQNNTYFIDDGPAMITQLMATTSCSNSTTATPDDSSAGLVAPNNYDNHYIVDTTTATGTVDNSYNYSVTGAGSSSGCYVSDDNTTAATALPPPTNNSIDYNNYIEDKVVGTITKTDAAVPASASTSPMDDAYLLSAQQMYAQQQEQQNLLFGQVLNGFHGMIGTNQSHVVDNTNTITNENYGIVPSLLPESTNITPYKLCGRQQQASSSYPCVSSDSPSSSYYWSLREKLFGSNRSKLPMNQTGCKCITLVVTAQLAVSCFFLFASSPLTINLLFAYHFFVVKITTSRS